MVQKINSQQELFCQTYVTKQISQTQAYLTAYSCTKCSAYASANRLLKKAKIRLRISQIRSEIEPKLPLIELAVQSLTQSLSAKKVIRIKGGYIEVPHYAVQLRALRMVSKFQEKLIKY